jgi:ABC-type Zn2+ transport system substrate-binding protein/surface adhesin
VCFRFPQVKVKVKFTPEQATKAQSGSRGIALLFLLLLRARTHTHTHTHTDTHTHTHTHTHTQTHTHTHTHTHRQNIISMRFSKNHSHVLPTESPETSSNQYNFRALDGRHFVRKQCRCLYSVLKATTLNDPLER